MVFLFYTRGMNNTIEVVLLNIGLILVPLLIIVPVFFVTRFVVRKFNLGGKSPRVFIGVTTAIVSVIIIGILLFIASASVGDIPNQA